MVLALVSVLTVSLLVAPTGSASTVVNPFAGNWSTFNGTGTLTLNRQTPAKGAASTAFYSKGTANCPSGTTYYAGNYRVSTGESGEIAGCTDASGRHLMLWYRSSVNGNRGTVTLTMSSNDASFTGTYQNLAANTSGAYDGTFTSDFPDSGRTAPGGASRPRIAVESPVVLLGAETWRATPNGATNYEFEIKRASAATWIELANGRSDTYHFVARVAGHLDVRVIETTDGSSRTSAPQSLEVQFPAWDEIASDETVNAAAVGAWDETIAATNPKTGVQEQGFWIRLDTCTGSYSHTVPIKGTRRIPMPPPASQPDVMLGPPPADTPADPQLLGCATYTVASFHTHTSTAYWPFSKGVGPSPEDNQLASKQGIPGLVYDYLPHPADRSPAEIPGDYLLDGPAKIYRDGPSRRVTPP